MEIKKGLQFLKIPLTIGGLSDFVLPNLKQIEFNDNEYAYDNTAVITFVSQGLEPECYIAGKRVEK